MKDLFIDIIKNILFLVKEKKAIDPEEGKAMVERAMSRIKLRRVIDEYLRKGMPAKFFQNYVYGISETRDTASEYLYAYNGLNEIFPTFDMGYSYRSRANILHYVILWLFVILVLVQLLVSHLFFAHFVSLHFEWAVVAFMLTTYVLFEIYERVKKFVDKKMRSREDAAIKKLAKELDVMLMELTCIDKNAG